MRPIGKNGFQTSQSFRRTGGDTLIFLHELCLLFTQLHFYGEHVAFLESPVIG
jgi:hypothetical protein